MALADRLLEALTNSARKLAEQPQLVAQADLCSVTLIGSLSRGDFIEAGSDVDLLLVQRRDSEEATECGRHPPLREVVQLFGEPILRLARTTGRQKPLVLDCHFVNTETARTQPQWADPTCFSAAELGRDPYLWLYAFDLRAHAQTLWGEAPTPNIVAYDPRAYLPVFARQLQEQFERLSACAAQAVVQRQLCTFTGGVLLDGLGMPRVGSSGVRVPDSVIADWKRLTGQLLTTLALQYGPPSLLKRDVFRHFNLRVPYFPGKDFAGHLWSEYLYGIVYDERDEWVRRCARLCENGLKLLTSQ